MKTLLFTKCPLCGQNRNYNVLYKQNFSTGDINHATFSARRSPDRIHYRFVKCKNDGLIRANPRLSQNELSALYQGSRFTYQRETENLTKTYLINLSLVLNKISHQAKLLEIGCGNGFLLSALFQKGYREVYGIEPSIEAFNKASAVIRKKIRRSIFKPGIFPSSFFDFIFFFQTFDHIAEPNRFLEECYRLLRPGGYILSFNHDAGSFWAKILKDRNPIIDIEHTFLYTRHTARQIFIKNRYKVIKVSSTDNTISLGHLLWLLPFLTVYKKRLFNTRKKLIKSILSLAVRVKLGNLCIVGQKPLLP
jgi:SAM-dependent methyltransferase